MEQLPPIPTPPAQRWREFRIQILPIVFFLGVVLAVVFLWRSYVTPAGIVGEVEAIRANVTIVEPGTLSSLEVELFQTVTNGQRLGTVRAYDPESTRAQVDAIRAELKLLESRIHLDVQRNHQDYYQFQLSLMDQKVQLEVAKANFIGAERELNRLETARVGKDAVFSESDLDTARTTRDALLAEIKNRSDLIKQVEEKLEELRLSDQAPQGSNNPIHAAIETQQRALELLEKPSTLRSPIDGVVSAIALRPGEKVLAGQPIITITSPHTERILGYVRPPITVEPEVGMEVEVRPRSFKRKVATAQVLGVGVQLESISSARFQTGLSSNIFEQALPIAVSLPTSLDLLPGEIVDLTLRPRGR